MNCGLDIGAHDTIRHRVSAVFDCAMRLRSGDFDLAVRNVTGGEAAQQTHMAVTSTTCVLASRETGDV